MRLTAASNRLFRVLRQTEGKRGARKVTVLRGLCATDGDFERAVGQLFLLGVVQWYGRSRGRALGTRS